MQLPYTTHLRQTDILEYFIEQGATIDVRNNYGETPLHRAVSENHFEVCKCLIEHGPNVNERTDAGLSPVYLAAENNRALILDYLVDEKHADVNIPSKVDNMTPLQIAAHKDYYDVCKYLIDHGANARATTSSGKTPVQIIKSYWYPSNLIQLLEDAMAKERNRRSLSFFPSALQHNPMAHNSKQSRIIGNFFLDTDAHKDSVRHFGHSNIDAVFQSFLAIATLLTRSSKINLGLHGAFLNQIDPIAVDAINVLAEF